MVSESYFDDLKEQKYMGKRMTAAALVTQLMSWRQGWMTVVPTANRVGEFGQGPMIS